MGIYDSNWIIVGKGYMAFYNSGIPYTPAVIDTQFIGTSLYTDLGIRPWASFVPNHENGMVAGFVVTSYSVYDNKYFYFYRPNGQSGSNYDRGRLIRRDNVLYGDG